MSTSPVELRNENETYELVARMCWQSSDRVSGFHKNINSVKGSKLFNREFREIYWKIGREEFPEKIIALQELRGAQMGFSGKFTSYQKSKLLNKLN